MRIFINKRVAAIAAAFALSSIIGCGGGSSDSSNTGAGTSGVTVSGSISSSSSLMSVLNSQKENIMSGENGSMAVNLGDLEIYVIYTSGSTVGIKQATVNSTTGSWSFEVPADSQINAIVRNKTSLELVGPIVFVDSTQTDLSGNAKSSSVTSFKSGVSLGTITLDSESGKFKVDVTAATIKAAQGESSTTPTSTIDFSGAWTIAAYDGTLPSGFNNACASGNNECHGAPVGQEIYFLKLTGNKFTYSGGNCATYKTNHTGSCTPSDGTTDTTVTLTAASVWGGASSITSCGYKMGFTRADALAGGGINIDPTTMPSVSGNQMTLSSITFAAPSGFGGDTATPGDSTNLNNLPWMKTGATSAYDMPSCFIVEKTGTDSKIYKLNVCSGHLHTANTTGYNAHYGGGCVTSDNKPVQIKNWAGLTSQSCTTPTTFAGITGMTTNTCSYSGVSNSQATESAFTCTFTGGTFANANLTTPAASGDYLDSFDKVTAGTACKNITSAIQRYKCYANAYYMDKPEGDCTKEYSFNWNATNVADFVKDDNRDRPNNNFLTNLVTYSSDGGTFYLEDHQEDAAQASSGANSTVLCRLDRTTLLQGKKISDSKILITLSESTTLKDSLVAACVASKNDSTSNGGNGSELYQRMKDSNKQMFYMNK